MTEKLKNSVMKTLRIFTLTVALLTSAIVGNATEKADSADISKQIQSSIQTPGKIINDDAQSRVLVVFSIDENGKAVVHEIGSNDEAVRNDLIAQFAEMNFNAESGVYSIWLNFKTL
jgi:flagellar basal body-associated protein FliL